MSSSKLFVGKSVFLLLKGGGGMQAVPRGLGIPPGDSWPLLQFNVKA